MAVTVFGKTTTPLARMSAGLKAPTAPHFANHIQPFFHGIHRHILRSNHTRQRTHDVIIFVSGN